MKNMHISKFLKLSKKTRHGKYNIDMSNLDMSISINTRVTALFKIGVLYPASLTHCSQIMFIKLPDKMYIKWVFLRL